MQALGSTGLIKILVSRQFRRMNNETSKVKSLEKVKEQDGMILAKVKEQDGIMLAKVKVPSIPTSAA